MMTQTEVFNCIKELVLTTDPILSKEYHNDASLVLRHFDSLDLVWFIARVETKFCTPVDYDNLFKHTKSVEDFHNAVYPLIYSKQMQIMTYNSQRQK